MFANIGRALGALIVGAALLAAPLGSQAQSPAPPITAPTGKVPDNPARGMKPEKYTPTGSTPLRGWNNPPASGNAARQPPQYASIPGRETTRLIQAEGRKWRAFRNGP